jgi:hypothetical protein
LAELRIWPDRRTGMARLFPKIDPAEIENPGERKVAEALVGQLASRVEVFHSFHWLGAAQKGTLIEGECDFVVLDPASGLLFIEVKGGSLLFDPDRKEWRRVLPSGRTRLLGKDPFEQVGQSMHEIAERIRAVLPGGREQLPFTYGYAVAFPDCRYTGTLPASIVPDLILDAGKCADMLQSIERVFGRFRRHGSPELSSREVQAVREALYPRYGLVPVIWRKVEDQEERLRRLTMEQQRLLDFLGSHTKAAIRGIAGSGKTILALAKAQETARRGLRTLFLCYNRPLKDWIKQAIPETFGDNLVIDNYHGMVEGLCRAAAIQFRPGTRTGDVDFWRDKAPELLMEACDLLGPDRKFDALVVDEGQDFHDLWWTSLEFLFRDPNQKACYYVFLDPNQNLYVKNPSIPGELGVAFELPVNCRNTVRIAEHCAELVNQTNRVRDDAPIGDAPKFIRAESLHEAFQQAAKHVREWCMPNAGGLKPSQVAVLAPGDSEREWPKDFQTVPTTRDFDHWRRGKGVLLVSWSRFKGLEADAVVIIETASYDDARERANRYVARSRAKHLLTVIQTA